MGILRRKRGSGRRKPENPQTQSGEESDFNSEQLNLRLNSAAEKSRMKWSCVESCCWFIGSICSMWWFLLFLYNAMPASLPQYVTEAITGPLPDPPGVKLAKEGLKAKHPVVFVPGIVTGGLELWEGHSCAEGLFRKRLWGGTFGEVYKSTFLIANLARIGYEDKNMFMAAYDWRLSFQNTEVRDQTLSRIKSNIELMVATSGGKKVVVVPHSMGALYFLHFMKWVEAPASVGGGGGGSNWCADHIKTVMNIGGPFLGLPKAVTSLFSAEAKDIAIARALAPGILDKDVFGFQTLQHVLRMTRTWDSTMSLLLKGGETIWGGLDWSPEEGHVCSSKKKNGNGQTAGHDRTMDLANFSRVKYGRLLSFGKDVADSHSSEIELFDFRGAIKGSNLANTTCRAVWSEYHDMGIEGIKAVSDYKIYTASSVLDLLHFVAPKMMRRGGAHFSYGIAEDLSDPKYNHYKYWANPLETKLPNAPEMEIFSMYGVGIPTERAYVYKFSPAADCFIPFQIDSSAEGGSEGHCLKGGVYSVDGDETVPVLSAGFTSAKLWRGKTRFNPSGIRNFIREYSHAPPTTLLEGRGTQSGAHVDILGNSALIEDVIRVAAGANGEDIGGDQVHSDIFKWSDRIKLKL
ncbi:Phospholipid:diacylglycerol acyltransferase 1 [Orobanche minor]